MMNPVWIVEVNFEEGGEFYLDDHEIEHIRANGGVVRYLD
jgi:uncharacterized protein YlzI (FlbEa/FlbD family)